jgi:hypothetical protein
VTRAHDDRVLGRIREVAALEKTVFDGEVPKENPDGTPLERPTRYVNVHSNRGTETPERLAGPATRIRKTYWIHSVGASKRQADAVAEAVIGKLLGWKPDVPGFSCERMRHPTSQPTQKDETVSPPIYFAVDVFETFTTRL